MTTLAINAADELCVTLRGVTEDRVLTTLRGWPYWLRADIERDAAQPKLCTAVTLVTSRVHEATIREILKRSFGLVFPAEGGSLAVEPLPPTVSRRR